MLLVHVGMHDGILMWVKERSMGPRRCGCCSIWLQADPENGLMLELGMGRYHKADVWPVYPDSFVGHKEKSNPTW